MTVTVTRRQRPKNCTWVIRRIVADLKNPGIRQCANANLTRPFLGYWPVRRFHSRNCAYNV